jgi:hypothetical protein
MKRTRLLIASLAGGIILAMGALLLTNLAVAREIPGSESDTYDLVVTPWDSQASEDNNQAIAITIPLEGEDTPEDEQGLISVTVALDRNAALPERPAEVIGVFLEESGDFYSIGSYADHPLDGQRTCQRRGGEIVTRVVAAESTRFIEDVTDFSQASPVDGPSDLHVQQDLRPIQQPVEIPECASMLVWGEWDGDRLIAEAILFHDES